METKQVARPAFRTRGQITANNINMIGAVYGDYGVGKTHFASTVDRVVRSQDHTQYDELLYKQLPDGWAVSHKTLFANAEQGEEGIPLDCPGIIIKDLFTYKEFSRLYDFLKLHTRLKQAGNAKEMLKLQNAYFQITPDMGIKELYVFDAVVVDSLTEIQKFCLYQLIGLSQDSKLEEEPEYMQMRQWGTALEMILLMVRNFRALPGMCKLFIIQQIEDQDERKQLFYRPALQGQARLSILGFYDFVGYLAMQVKEDGIHRRLFLTPVGNFKAKHRFEKFTGYYLDDPSMETLFEARAGKINK